MFQLHMDRLGGLDVYRFQKDMFSVAFIPDFGGTLNEFIADVGGKTVPIIEGYADGKELISTYSRVFKSAKLSPYPNRILNGRYEHAGKGYVLEKNFLPEENSIHGLVYEKPFVVERTECKNDSAEISLVHKYSKDHDGYPFKYSLTVNYSIRKNRLTCQTIIENKDEVFIPIGDGWHPYFTLGEKIDALELQLPKCTLLKEKDLIPTGEVKEYSVFSSPKKIGTEKFDSCFKLQESSGRADIALIDRESKIRLNIWQECGENKYKYFQLYTPPSGKSIAIEPMSCPADAFNSKKDLILLAPKQAIRLSWGFEIGTP